MRLSDGTTYCWGTGNHGENGTGTASNTARPATAVVTTPLAGATITALASSQDARCAIDSNGAVWCWGRNQAGELGINDKANKGNHTVLTQVTGLTGVTSIEMNHHTACAVDGNHQLYCWGNNRRGQITHAAPTSAADDTLFVPTLVSL
jgi:hypothetical protein